MPPRGGLKGIHDCFVGHNYYLSTVVFSHFSQISNVADILLLRVHQVQNADAYIMNNISY